MSASNVIEITDVSLEEDISKLYCEAGHKYMLKKRFKVGAGVDLDKMHILEKLRRVLDYCDCLIDIDKDTVRQQIKKLTY